MELRVALLLLQHQMHPCRPGTGLGPHTVSASSLEISFALLNTVSALLPDVVRPHMRTNQSQPVIWCAPYGFLLGSYPPARRALLTCTSFFRRPEHLIFKLDVNM